MEGVVEVGVVLAGKKKEVMLYACSLLEETS
jgi:hypothetical protein